MDAFLPPFEPIYRLDPDNPLTVGAFAEPDKYTETRYMIQRAIEAAIPIIEDVARDFSKAFGRPSYGLFEEYRTDDAATIVVAMGSMAGTVKEVVDELRAQGQKVGLLRLITYRPLPVGRHSPGKNPVAAPRRYAPAREFTATGTRRQRTQARWRQW